MRLRQYVLSKDGDQILCGDDMVVIGDTDLSEVMPLPGMERSPGIMCREIALDGDTALSE